MTFADLEFNKRSNPQLTPAIAEDLLTELFNEVKHQFELLYKIVIERSNMVDLDSSTPIKFSRHWIVHLHNKALFRDARAAGMFVKALVARLDEEKESGALQKRDHELLSNNLFVNAEDSKEGEEAKLIRFIDLGVYTRNRLFRLMASTKFGKPADAALRIAEANEFEFSGGFGNSKFYLPDMNSASYKGESNAEVGIVSDYERFCNSMSWESHASALADTLVVPANATKMSLPILTDPDELLGLDNQQKLKLMNGVGTGRSVLNSLRPATSYGKSPFSQLESFIVNNLSKRGGGQGSISTWSFGLTTQQHSLPQSVSFNIKDNRYCEHVGRAHKSNNIIWNVHLIDRVCWQSCHDPECRGFKGEHLDLPDDVNNEIDEFFLDQELSSLNEDQIVDGALSNDTATYNDDEFDDPLLEEALLRLNVSSVEKSIKAESKQPQSLESEFDDPLLEEAMGKLNI